MASAMKKREQGNVIESDLQVTLSWVAQRFLRNSDIWAEICVDRKRQPLEKLGKEKFCIRNSRGKNFELGAQKAEMMPV